MIILRKRRRNLILRALRLILSQNKRKKIDSKIAYNLRGKKIE